MKMITLKTKRWLSEEEFKELLKISDYKGYGNGVSTFVFNFEKAVRNGYGYEDVVALINDLDVEIEGRDLEKIESMYRGVRVKINWDNSSGCVRVDVPWFIFNKLKDTLRRCKARFTYRDDKGVTYRVPPYYFRNLYGEMKYLGVEVEDPAGLMREKPLPETPILRNIALRDYQAEALEKWVENGYRGIIALPTGAGKTIVAIAALTKKPVRTLIVAYTREQMFQWRDSIVKYTNVDSRYIGLMYSEEKRISPITITTYQTGFRVINDISPNYGMLIIDEVHHLPADKFKHIVLHSLAEYMLGLSATPIREDGKHEELFPLMGGIVYYRSPSDLMKRGYLAKYKIVTVRVDLTEEERRTFEELRRRYRELAGLRRFEEVLEDAKRGDQKAIEALKINSEIRMLLSRSKAKVDAVAEIARKEIEKGSKIIVFTQYVDQAKEIARKLGAYLITGETSVDDRKTFLRKFREEPSGILVVTTVGDEGLDIPDANVGIIVSGTGSRRQFIQRLGRLLRPKKNDVEAVMYEVVLKKTMEEFQARRRKNLFI